MKVFRRELKSSIKMLLIWVIVIALFIAAGMTKYKGYSAGGMDITALLDKFPPIILAMFGFTGFNLEAVEGFYGIIFQYLVLMAGFFSAHIGCNTILKEERDKTTEFLLVKPISRRKVVFEKWLSNIISLVVFAVAAFIISIVALKAVAPDSNITTIIFKLNLTMFLVEFFIMNIGMFMASALKYSNKMSGYAMYLVFIFYLLAMVIDYNEAFHVMTILCPLRYFNVADIVNGISISFVYYIVSVLGGIILLFSSLHLYNKRDLNN